MRHVASSPARRIRSGGSSTRQRNSPSSDYRVPDRIVRKGVGMAGERHLARLGEEAFERLGDHEALYFEGRWYRSGELAERGRRLAGGFVELGIEPGDRVVVMMANTPEVGVTYSALWRAGAAITPAIFLLPPAELRHILGNSEARAVVTTPEFLPNVRTAAEGIETLKWGISAGPVEDGVLPRSSLVGA